jgi:hypothetical protein
MLFIPMAFTLDTQAASPSALGCDQLRLNREGEPPREPSDMGSVRASRKSPLFPNFKPLEMDDRAEIEAFTRRFEPYSDFCFSTLVFYNGSGHTRWSWLDGNLVLHLKDGFGSGAYFTILGHQKIVETAGTLIDYAMETNCSPVLRLVSDVAVHALREADAFHIEPERDCFDYVYQLDALARMEGASHYGVRRDVTRFKRRHPNHRFIPLDLTDKTTHAQLADAITAWQSQKGGAETMGSYCRALDHCLCAGGGFELVGIGVVADGRLSGFAVGDRINKDWLLSHFAAADPTFTGLSASLLHHMARKGLELGCTHLNYQEDLGDPGLRRFKMKCVPSHFLRKFSVRRSGPV